MAGIEDLTNRGVEFAENFEMPDARSAGEGANIFMDEGRKRMGPDAREGMEDDFFKFDAKQFMIDQYNEEGVQPEILGEGFQGNNPMLIIRTPNFGTMSISLEDFIKNFGEPPMKAKGIERDALDQPYRYNQGGKVGYNQGGRIGYQAGGVTETRNLPPEYIEALGKTYAADLTRQAGIPSITTATAQQPGETAQQWQQRQGQAQQYGITKAGMAELAPQVAAQDPYQAAAYAQATDPTTGLGGYQPYLQAAGTAATTAGGLTGPMTGAQLATIDPTTGQTVTPTLAPGSYMSPYQQQVIDTTMADYDAQAAKSRLGLGAQAVAGGAYGAGRHGIAEAEFDALSNRGRSSQLANLRATGFQQAQQSRQQDLQNQMGLSNLQQGLGGTQQDFSRAQIAGLGTLGSTQQAQNQAVLDAQRQFATMADYDAQAAKSRLGLGAPQVAGVF